MNKMKYIPENHNPQSGRIAELMAAIFNDNGWYGNIDEAIEIVKKLHADKEELFETVKELLEQCAMIHKYGGEADNTEAANAAIAAVRAALIKV